MEDFKYLVLDVREKLLDHYSKLNLYLNNGDYSKNKSKRYLFSNDTIFKFISHPHLSIRSNFKKEVNEDNKKGAKRQVAGNSGTFSLPEFNETYLNYEIQNFLKEDGQEFDPFYYIWQKQIELYYEELNKLTREYFEGVSVEQFSKDKLYPIDIFTYYNKKVVKLLRREQLIFALMGNSPSVVPQIIRDKVDRTIIKTKYYSLRCNWIDDNGDIDRTIRISLNDIGRIEINKNEKEGTEEILAPDFIPSMYHKQLCEALSEFGFFEAGYSSNGINGVNYIKVNDKTVELVFDNSRITFLRVLSLIEYLNLAKEFIHKYSR